MNFKLTSSYEPSGDQPEAIEKLVEGLNNGEKAQTLLGVTGSGKTFTIANVLSRVNRPAQDPRRAALQRVQAVFPRKRRGILRFLLRLLPTGGVYSDHKHLH